MKDEFKIIFNSLPKRIIVSILVIALSVIVSLVAYIGKTWYKNWQDYRESDKKEIIDVIKTEINIVKQDNIELHNSLDQNMDRLSNKIDVISDNQDENTKRLIKQIDKDLKREESVRLNSEESYLPDRVKPVENELQTLITDPDFKKKL